MDKYEKWIYLGNQLDHWKEIKRHTKAPTDQDFAKLLLDKFTSHATSNMNSTPKKQINFLGGLLSSETCVVTSAIKTSPCRFGRGYKAQHSTSITRNNDWTRDSSDSAKTMSSIHKTISCDYDVQGLSKEKTSSASSSSPKHILPKQLTPLLSNSQEQSDSEETYSETSEPCSFENINGYRQTDSNILSEKEIEETSQTSSFKSRLHLFDIKQQVQSQPVFPVVVSPTGAMYPGLTYRCHDKSLTEMHCRESDTDAPCEGNNEVDQNHVDEAGSQKTSSLIDLSSMNEDEIPKNETTEICKEANEHADNKMQCAFCYYESTSMLDLKVHREKRHQITYLNSIITSQNYSPDLGAHIGFICPECYTTTDCAEYIRHAHSSVHQRFFAPQYRCNVCSELFMKMSAIIEHLSKIHDIGITECSRCSKKFISHHAMKLHQRKCGKGKKRNGGMCHECGSYNKNLTMHMSRVHCKERRYECPTCRRRFKTKSCMNVHIRIHTNEKPHKCKYCDYAGRQYNCINWHMKTSHPDKIKESGGLK